MKWVLASLMLTTLLLNAQLNEAELMQFSKAEEEAVYLLAEKLTGSSQKGSSRKSVLVHNVIRRVQSLQYKSLASYLEFALSDAGEYKKLMSALTIHFTNWFRESDVFTPIHEHWLSSRSGSEPFRVLCAACSTGEEVYSLALFLESKRSATTGGPDYKILGVDIDPMSIATCRKSVYLRERAKDIPPSFQRFLAFGSGKSQGFFTLAKEIRDRCQFLPGDLRNLKSVLEGRNAFDAILCRNVLIYFDAIGVQQIVSTLVKQLLPGGILCLGHSETVNASQHGLTTRGKSLYRLPLNKVTESADNSNGRVLVVDDSTVIRKIISSLLSRLNFEVESVESAAAASRALSEGHYDLITLDLHMPEVDGATWLAEQRRVGLKTPVVIVSDASPSEADEVLGVLMTLAQDYIEKKDLQENPQELGERLKAIILQKKPKSEKVTDLIRPATPIETWKRSSPELIVVGASTGGTEALVKMMKMMSPQSPPVLVVQHISPSFGTAFAQRLATASGLKLGKMTQDEVLERGYLYVALGDYHIGIKKQGSRMLLDISYGAKEHAVRPAIDYLFRSVARTKFKALGCILTGMGKDGALGLLDIRHANGLTMSQSEDSCVVYGMPREAVQVGASQFVGDLSELRREIDACVHSVAVAI